MTASLAQDGGSAADISIPRGGPIYTPNMVSPLTRVSDFEASVVQELQNLQTDLCSDSTETCDDDIFVEELKIITEEQLVSRAFEEAFKDDDEVGDTMSTRNSNACSEGLGHGTDTVSANGCVNGYSRRNHESSIKNMAKKKKRINGKNHNLEDYSAKVEQIVKIKQKQDEEKAAARLHSFNGDLQTNKDTVDTERMTSLRSIGCATNLNSSNIHSDHLPVIYPEIVLCVEVYNNKKIWVKSQEFLVLGRQPLTELRDKIHCLTDQVMQKAGQHDPSGYFLIEDVFCNDLRDSKAIDYSEPILNWFRNSKNEALEKWEWIVSGELQKKQKEHLERATASQLPCFRAVDMLKTRICDLRFRVGAGYVYCHQGDCKHIVVVRDMRLIHPKDAQNRKVYPIVTFQLKERFQKCSVCKICKAEKMTVDDKWAADNPCYFCKNCYYMLHYGNGSLLYEGFSVYDYICE